MPMPLKWHFLVDGGLHSLLLQIFTNSPESQRFIGTKPLRVRACHRPLGAPPCCWLSASKAIVMRSILFYVFRFAVRLFPKPFIFITLPLV